MKIAVILGSSRSDGNTRQLTDEFTSQANAVFFNVADYDISAYDYRHDNRSDDLLPLISELTFLITLKYSTIGNGDIVTSVASAPSSLSKPYTRVELATKVRYVLDNVDAG